MLRRFGVGTLGVLAIAVVPSLAAATSPNYWQAGKGKHAVSCGLEIHAAGKPAKYVLCSAVGLPKVRGGDPFVQLAARGKPQIVPISQFSYYGKSGRLKTGAVWSAVGVTCKVSATVTCTNKDGHGFTIGTGHYKHF